MRTQWNFFLVLPRAQRFLLFFYWYIYIRKSYEYKIVAFVRTTLCTRRAIPHDQSLPRAMDSTTTCEWKKREARPLHEPSMHLAVRTQQIIIWFWYTRLAFTCIYRDIIRVATYVRLFGLRPCLVVKNFQDFPSHRILRHMHEVLNIYENKNYLHSSSVNREMNLLSLDTL